MRRTMLATAIAGAALATALNAHAGVPRHPEAHRIWEDAAVRTSAQKGLKGKTRAQTSGLPTGKRQHKPFSLIKPTAK